jgi:tRNA A-37 threonylcarbamoyl transferase component Bud32
VKQEKKKIATDIKVLEDPSKNVTNKSEDTLSRGLSTYEKYMQSLP